MHKVYASFPFNRNTSMLTSFLILISLIFVSIFAMILSFLAVKILVPFISRSRDIGDVRRVHEDAAAPIVTSAPPEAASSQISVVQIATAPDDVKEQINFPTMDPQSPIIGPAIGSIFGPPSIASTIFANLTPGDLARLSQTCQLCYTCVDKFGIFKKKHDPILVALFPNNYVLETNQPSPPELINFFIGKHDVVQLGNENVPDARLFGSPSFLNPRGVRYYFKVGQIDPPEQHQHCIEGMLINFAIIVRFFDGNDLRELEDLIRSERGRKSSRYPHSEVIIVVIDLRNFEPYGDHGIHIITPENLPNKLLELGPIVLRNKIEHDEIERQRQGSFLTVVSAV
jgi:hypothetical protein